MALRGRRFPTSADGLGGPSYQGLKRLLAFGIHRRRLWGAHAWQESLTGRAVLTGKVAGTYQISQSASLLPGDPVLTR